MQDITITTLLESYDKYLEPSSDARQTLLLYLASQELHTDVSLDSNRYTIIDDETMFKAGLLSSSAAIPVS